MIYFATLETVNLSKDFEGTTPEDAMNAATDYVRTAPERWGMPHWQLNVDADWSRVYSAPNVKGWMTLTVSK